MCARPRVLPALCCAACCLGLASGVTNTLGLVNRVCRADTSRLLSGGSRCLFEACLARAALDRVLSVFLGCR